MTQPRWSGGAIAALVIATALLASCSAVGVLSSTAPSATPSVLPSGPQPSGEATAAAATAGSGVIYPETFDPNATPPPTPAPTPFATPQPAGLADLIYTLAGQLGRPDWCDPDFYPLARADEVTLAPQHLDEMQADPALYATILEHNGLGAQRQLSDQQLVSVYRDWKMLTKAIALTPTADGYSFDYVACVGRMGGRPTTTWRARSLPLGQSPRPSMSRRHGRTARYASHAGHSSPPPRARFQSSN